RLRARPLGPGVGPEDRQGTAGDHLRRRGKPVPGRVQPGRQAARRRLLRQGRPRLRPERGRLNRDRRREPSRPVPRLMLVCRPLVRSPPRSRPLVPAVLAPSPPAPAASAYEEPIAKSYTRISPDGAFVFVMLAPPNSRPTGAPPDELANKYPLSGMYRN